MNKKISVAVILATTIVSLFFAFRLRYVEFDYNLESFFPQSDPDTQFFNEYRKTFSSDNDFLLIGIRDTNGIFRPSFMSQIDSISKALQTFPLVENVQSPLDLFEPVMDPFFGTIVKKNVIRQKDQTQATLEQDSSKIYTDRKFIGSFFANDGKSISILVTTEPYLSKLQCDTLALAVEETMNRFSLQEVHIAGRSVGQRHYIELTKKELLTFLTISAGLLILFLIIAFKSFWGVWLPMLVVILAVIWLMGFIQVINFPVSLMLAMLPSIIFVVGISDVVHLVNKYLHELRLGRRKFDALKLALKEVGLATFLTSLTTAIGFFTLILISIEPIMHFGFLTGIGVFIAYILAFTFFPATLALLPVPKTAKQNFGSSFWIKVLRSAFIWTFRNAKTIIIGSTAILAISVALFLQVDINNFLLEDLRKSDNLRQDFIFFDQNFSGARPLELAILAKDSIDYLDYELYNQLDKIENYLSTDYGAGLLLSPLTGVKMINQASHGGNIKYFKLPESKAQFDKLSRHLKTLKRNKFMLDFYSEQNNLIRISGKMADHGSKVFKTKNRDFEKFVATNIDSTKYQVKLTGTAELIDKNNSNVAKGMMLGLLAAFAIVAIIMAILYKSLPMVLVALVPNLLPILMIGGLMGLSGIDLKVSTAIIFTIAFGIAVDDTIHFMSKLNLELRKGKSILYAIKSTYLSTGKAIIVTSLILCAGFLSLITSSFLGTFYVGLLISLTLLFAVLSDLLLLPLLIAKFYKTKS